MSKLIGITSTATETTLTRDGLVPAKTSVNSAYIAALTRAGFTPVVLPTFVAPFREAMGLDEFKEMYREHIERLGERLDGIVISGGADLSPLPYGEDNWGAIDPNTMRDLTETALVEAFIARGKPLLGICRGYQLVSRYLDLKHFLQDLGDTKEFHNGADREFKHRQEAAHSIYLFGTLRDYLRREMNKPELTTLGIKSWHHQGFCLEPTGKLPKGVKTADDWQVWFARAFDQYQHQNDITILASTGMVIEAVERPAIQFVGYAAHPEEYGPQGRLIGYWLDRYLPLE